MDNDRSRWSMSDDSFEIVDFPPHEDEEDGNIYKDADSVSSGRLKVPGSNVLPDSSDLNKVDKHQDLHLDIEENCSRVIDGGRLKCGHVLCTCDNDEDIPVPNIEMFEHAGNFSSDVEKLGSDTQSTSDISIPQSRGKHSCTCNERLSQSPHTGLILSINYLTKQKPTCVHCSPDLSSTRRLKSNSFTAPSRSEYFLKREAKNLSKNKSKSLKNLKTDTSQTKEASNTCPEQEKVDKIGGKENESFPEKPKSDAEMVSLSNVAKRRECNLTLQLKNQDNNQFDQTQKKPHERTSQQTKLNQYFIVPETLPTPVCRRGDAMTAEEFSQLLDTDGRLVDEHAFRKAVFMGGVDPSIRKQVWQFLFSLYPYSSTTREREELLLDYIMKYHEQTSRWKTMLVLNARPGASLLQQGLVARYQIEDSNNVLRSPEDSPEDPISEFELLERNLMAGKMKSGKPDFNALSKNFQAIDISSPEMQQKMDFMKIQAQVYVNRQKIDIKNLWTHIRVIDKDVPRTDRDLDYFKGAMNHNLTVLRNILITFAAFHPHIGYAQGMNDILAQFLVVFDSEVEAYWCFSSYMEKIQKEFTEDGMVKKISLVALLLQEMDPALYDHLKENELGDLLFCHRWLLLGFKREFKFMDSLRCFEILSSHHLELTSMEADKARRNELKKEFENIRGVQRTTQPSDTDAEYTFELFMCIALLQEARPDLMECNDTAMVFSVINSMEINLDDILLKAADLFYMYCKKTVEESFLMVDSPQPQRAKIGTK